MRYRRRAGRRLWVVSVLGILLCVMLCGRAAMAVEDTEQNVSEVFDIGAKLIPLGDRTYDIQLTIGNQGADWEGIVRMRMDDSSYDAGDCDYDTVLSLPQGSTKQFTVRIPKDSIEYAGGALHVFLLDKKSNKVAEKEFKRFLLEEADVLSMGILSDSYQSLTYLDLGGDGLYYGGSELPIKLLELDQDNLISTLDSLVFLVIDNYNTGVLTDEEIDSIRQWVSDGGMLIVGTGRRAEDTLRGLDFMDVECRQINEPEEGGYDADYMTGLSQLPLADLHDMLGQYHMDRDSLIMIASQGDGAMEVVPYGLSDLGQPSQVVENWESIVWRLLQNVNGYVRIQNVSGGYGYYDDYYILHRIFRMFGNGGSRLNFGGLKWIVILYVIFVGPVLYLILRAMNKRDLYWIAVPITTFVGILLVYFAGSGFEVVNTRVYSVTVENLSDPNSEAVTYMHCYDAGHKEWGLQLEDRYAYVGSILGGYYGSDDKYRVCKEGDRISFGMNPSTGFEDGYFIAGTPEKRGIGSISSALKTSPQFGITGTVTNGTDRDFKYFAVFHQNILYVCHDLPAGETCDLAQAQYASRQQGYASGAEAYLQGYLNDLFYGGGDNEDDKKDIDVIAALGTGVSAVNFVEDPDATVIIGVTENWDRTVDDDCTETSYGCLYAVQ